MTVRTGKNYAFGETLESADLNKGPQGWIARERVTGSNQTGISAETVLTAFSVTPTVQGSDRTLKCSAQVHTTSASTTAYAVVRIREGSVSGDIIASQQLLVGTGGDATFTPWGFYSPVNGTHTFVVTLATSTGTIASGMSSTFPGYVGVEDAGPAS